VVFRLKYYGFDRSICKVFMLSLSFWIEVSWSFVWYAICRLRGLFYL